MISEHKLKDAERLIRLTMIVILATAGISKLFSAGGFYGYYSELFQGDLRINLPALLVNTFLTAVPFIELGLAIALIVTRIRILAVHTWFAFMLSLLFGHYMLQEWSAVNQMLAYFFLGIVCLVLPAHKSWLAKPSFS